MTFNSYTFLIFFPVVACLYFLTPRRFRWVLLLGASYYFYMCWKPEFILLILLSTLVDYFAGLKMGRLKSRSERKKYLILSLAVNLGLLFSFKYWDFFHNSVNGMLAPFDLGYSAPLYNLILPIGISFYTFQTLSYTIEVYRGDRPPERHMGVFALYVAFFPQLVAGPIERAHRLLPQLHRHVDFDYARIRSGLLLMAWGLFKKVVIADRIAVVVNHIYDNPSGVEGLSLLVATVGFAFQIYCDFSAYSDIAVGGARVFGINLMQNFRLPYFARSVREFWTRWHISLSTWFRDYLYIPLGGNRVSVPRWTVNVLIVFVLSGFWHGAKWTYVIWGLLHGVYYIASMGTEVIRKRIRSLLGLEEWPRFHQFIQVIMTFSCVCFAWIFFRANSLEEALDIIRHLFTGWDRGVTSLSELGWGAGEWMGLAVLIIAMEAMHYLRERQNIPELLARQPIWLRWTVYASLTLSIMNLGMFVNEPFIYFTF